MRLPQVQKTGFILFPLVIPLADTVENSMTGIAMVTKGGAGLNEGSICR